MAHFAELDDGNRVLRVIVIADAHEADGPRFCANLLGGRWVQTSYTGSMRGKFAGIGDVYRVDADVFETPEAVE